MKIFVPWGREMWEGSLLGCKVVLGCKASHGLGFQEGPWGFQEVRHQSLCVFPILPLQSPTLAMRKLPNWRRMITTKGPRLEEVTKASEI